MYKVFGPIFPERRPRLFSGKLLARKLGWVPFAGLSVFGKCEAYEVECRTTEGGSILWSYFKPFVDKSSWIL